MWYIHRHNGSGPKEMRKRREGKIRLCGVVFGLIIALFTIISHGVLLHISPAFASCEPYDWPMHGYDPACTCFSPSTAPNTNATAWVSDLSGAYSSGDYPIVAEGKMFIGAGGYFTAWNETDGSFLWSYRAPDQPGAPHGSAAIDGRVFFGTKGGNIYALNTTTGEQIWNFTTESMVRNTVVVQDRLYFGVSLGNTGKVYCINTTDGAHIWNYTTHDSSVMVALAYDKVYVLCGHWDTPTKCWIYCFNMHDHSLVWSFDTGKDLIGHLSVANGKVYFTASYEGWDCVVYALNATNGDMVWSTTRYSNGEAGYTAVAYGKVFVSFQYGARGVYALNETNGDEIWAFPIIPEEPVAGYQNNPAMGAIADGKLFFSVGYPSHMVYAVNETTGDVVWSYKLAGSAYRPALANGRVFVADYYDPKLYAFGGPPVPPPLSASISPETAKAKIGESVTFTSTVSGGQSPYSYQWYLDGSAVSGATSSEWTFEPTTTGFYMVYLNVTENLGNTAKSNEASVTVKPKLTASISPMIASILVAQSVDFSSTVSGGYSPYSYQWYLNGNPVSGANSPSWAFTPTSEGTYYVYLEVMDDNNNIVQSETARITVSAVPVGGYSFSIKGHITGKSLATHFTVVALLTTVFIAIGRKTQRRTKRS
jgi:outer membrane protein assembly factor BamB